MASKLLAFLRPLTVASLLAQGGVRTRATGSGGGNIFTRHATIGPAGFLYFADGGVGTADGNPYARLGASGSPSQDFEIIVDPTGVNFTALSVDNDADRGRVYIPKLKRYTAIGLPMGVVNGSVAIPTGECARAIVPGDWTLVDWYMAVDSAGGPFRVEVLKVSNASYAGTVATTSVTGTTNAAGGVPRIGIGSVKNNGGSNISSWPAPSLAAGDIISANVLVNGASVKWAYLTLIGTKKENV